MNKFVYEVVALSPYGEDESCGFYVAYHFEDYFLNRSNALSFADDFVKWLLKEGMAKEAVKCSWESHSGSILALWRVCDGQKVEFYGVARSLILG